MPLYIQMFSIHGLVRGESPELGRDADTGGQVKYVLELAKALATFPEVEQVDLVTRLIADKTVSSQYAQPIEPLSDKARIVRIQCGGRKYIRKELLWPHLEEFTDKTLKFIMSQGRVPDIFHGHYADAGYLARELASIFGVPFVFTGHSMGRHKKDKLLSEGQGEEEINRRYRIDHRINVEEQVIKEAERIFTSTHHEKRNQYGLYDNFSAGQYLVTPPGIDLTTFYPYYDTQLDYSSDQESFKQARMALLQEMQRFWVDPNRPFILALCRPDQRKNISGLIKAYGESKELQAIANLAIFAGIRKNINEMEENERDVLTEMLMLMDQYDLYGKLAIPKKHDFSSEVPELYRICAENQGVFINPALVEPFGITLIEAAACGLPIIATKEGGPADIIGNCENGILVDPTNHQAIADAAISILVDRDLWQQYSSNGINGVRRYYAWEAHCRKAISVYSEVMGKVPSLDLQKDRRSLPVGRQLSKVRRLLFTDLDNILIGDDKSLVDLLKVFDKNSDKLLWGVATGRPIELTLEALAEHDIPVPDIMICSVGTTIFYGQSFLPDNGWHRHISYQWRPEAIKETLASLKFIDIQEPENQRPFKVSYYMEDDPDFLVRVHEALQARRLRYNLMFSNNQFLDVLPYRASKGKAVRYLSYKWGIPLYNIMICGESGNDEDLLRGDMCAVVVANHSSELQSLKGLRKVYFSGNEYAAGVIDGLNHYGFLRGEE